MIVSAAVVVMLFHHLAVGRVRLLGLALTSAGVLGLLAFIGWDLIRWLRTVPPDFGRYSPQRILFAVGTNPDVPLVQVAVAGIICWIGASMRERKERGAVSQARRGLPPNCL
jgi:hypothetical protein